MIKKMICILAIAALTLCGCKTDGAEINPSAESGALCEVYFVDNAGQTIKSEIAGLEADTQEQQVYEAFIKMKDTVKNEERRPAVPENVDINTLSIDSGVLEVDFSGEYNGMSPGDKLIFRTAVVYTFTSLDFVDYVKMTVDGNSLKMTNGQALGKIGRDDVVLDGNISAEPTNYEILTLYFKDSEENKLDTEIREVEVNPNQPIELYIIEQLISGPESKNMKNVIPTDTKIREISTADGICYVDLSAEFLVKQLESETDAKAAVYSIVNSLAEIETVNKVQFLIDGEKIDNYRGVMDLSKPVEPNFDITFE